VGAAARNRDELLRDELDEDDDELLLQFIWFVQKPNNGSFETKTSQQRVNAAALSMLRAAWDSSGLLRSHSWP